jgi:hypothetical protein
MELRAYPERFVNDSIVLRQFRRLYLEISRRHHPHPLGQYDRLRDCRIA